MCKKTDWTMLSNKMFFSNLILKQNVHRKKVLHKSKATEATWTFPWNPTDSNSIAGWDIYRLNSIFTFYFITRKIKCQLECMSLLWEKKNSKKKGTIPFYPYQISTITTWLAHMGKALNQNSLDMAKNVPIWITEASN